MHTYMHMHTHSHTQTNTYTHQHVCVCPKIILSYTPKSPVSNMFGFLFPIKVIDNGEIIQYGDPGTLMKEPNSLLQTMVK